MAGVLSSGDLKEKMSSASRTRNRLLPQAGALSIKLRGPFQVG